MLSIDQVYKILIKHHIPNAYPISRQLVESGLSTSSNVQLIIDGYPVDYILCDVEFFGVKIQVDSSVLIPRPETELLVQEVITWVETENIKKLNVLDLCSGSGCIAISLKKRFPSFSVFGIDFSKKAIEKANLNGRRNQVEVTFIQADLLEEVRLPLLDLVVANPPYISAIEYETLDKSVKDYEPEMALTDHLDGLSFYRRIEKQLPSFLNLGAKLFFEIGKDQKMDLFQIFSNARWKNLNCKKDYAGLDRFFSLEYAG